jgi:hypothetical protein
VADALNSVGYPITHVVTAFPLNVGKRSGQNRTPDEEIARWCAQTETVLVSTDEDFRGKWVRLGVLSTLGVEAIVFDHDLEGLRLQHERITKHFPVWEMELGRQPYGHRVWNQGVRNRVRLMPSTGRRIRPKSRPSPSTTVRQQRA